MPFATLHSMLTTKKSDLTWDKLFGVRVVGHVVHAPVPTASGATFTAPAKREEGVKRALGEELTPENITGIIQRHRHGKDDAIAASLKEGGTVSVQDAVRCTTSRLQHGDLVLDDFAKNAMALTEQPPSTAMALPDDLPVVERGSGATELHRQDAGAWPSHPADAELEIRRLELQIALMEQKRLDYVTVREQARLDLLAHRQYTDGEAARRRVNQAWEDTRRMNAVAIEQARKQPLPDPIAWGQYARDVAAAEEMRLEADKRMDSVAYERRMRGFR